jgi:septal ring factor EnvC (AmiA/AmiB activator)
MVIKQADGLDEARARIENLERDLALMAGELAAARQALHATEAQLAATETALWKANHTADELRHQLRLANRRGVCHCVELSAADVRTLVDGYPVWNAEAV